MGYKNRELEVKLEVGNSSLPSVIHALKYALQYTDATERSGSSVDTYWHIPWLESKSAFFRCRERDGIRQLTLKAEDRGDSTDRIEVDLDCTSPVHRIH